MSDGRKISQVRSSFGGVQILVSFVLSSMVPPRSTSQVSLRCASAREISRNALLQKVVHERELRNFTRRASAAAIFFQRVWRRFYVMKKVGKQLQEQWTALADSYDNQETVDWISSNLIRPFLFFTSSFTSHLNLNFATEGCLSVCFKILLQSINTADSGKNFCSQAVGTVEERSRWFFQAKKLSFLCFAILAKCDFSCRNGEDMISLTVLAMRLLVSLTDWKLWKSLQLESIGEADLAVKKLIFSLAGSGVMYSKIKIFLLKLRICHELESHAILPTENAFLITASALSLALSPFQMISECGLFGIFHKNVLLF